MQVSTSVFRSIWIRFVSVKLSLALFFLAAFVCLSTAASAQRQPPVDCTTGLPRNPAPGQPRSVPPIPHNASNPGNEYFCTITVTRNSDGSEDVEIEQPVVDEPQFLYLPIKLKPGDEITLTADGCAQRAGGPGATWNRYVNPQSPGPPFNSFDPNQQMYFGTITIPFAFQVGTNVPINDLPLSRLMSNRVIQIHQMSALAASLTPITFTLGYKDNNYTDHGGNGYWGQDGGEHDTCQDNANKFRDDPLTTGSFRNGPNNRFGGNAWVNLHIVHNAAMEGGSTVPMNFDIVSTFFDLNGFPLNPVWGWQLLTAAEIANLPPQTTAQERAAIASSNAGAFVWPPSLSSGKMPTTFMPFSSQIPKLDTYHGGLAGLCNWEAWQVDEIETGHLNWWTATFTGVITGGADHSQWAVGDDDLSMQLDASSAENEYTPEILNPPMSTGASGQNAEFEAEMTYGLTLGVDNMPLTNFWGQLNNGVPNAPFSGVGNTAAVVQNHRAIMIGQLGLDNVHPPSYAEIHPIYAMAIQETPFTNQSANDKWAVMAHRVNNEGSCSDMLYDAGTSRFVLEIIPPPQFRDPKTHLPNPGVTATLRSSDIRAAHVTPSGHGDSFQVLQPDPDGQFEFFPGDASHGAIVVLTVPDLTPEQSQDQGGINYNLVMGELELQWSGPQTPGFCQGNICSSGSPLTAAPTPKKETAEPEVMLDKVWTGLSHVQQDTANKVFLSLRPRPQVTAWHHLLERRLTSVPARPNSPPRAIVIRDPNGPAKHLAGVQSVCAATGGTMGTAAATMPLKAACAGQPPVTALTLSSSPLLAAAPPVDINGWYIAPVYVLPAAHSVSGAPLQETMMSIKPEGAAAQSFTYPNTAPTASPTRVSAQPPHGGQQLSLGSNSVSFATSDAQNMHETLQTRIIKVAPKVSFIGMDTTTQGNWFNAYGSDGEVVINSHFSNPNYVLPKPQGNTASTWNFNPAQDRRALNTISTSDRIAATWAANSSFEVALPVMDGQHHKFSVYCIDWDSDARAETLQLLDSKTGAVLDTRTISQFHDGVWLSWTISGNVTLKVIHNAGANAVISGLFFDKLPPEGTPPAITVTTPTNGSTYLATASSGISITPGFSANSAVGIATVEMTIDGARVTNTQPLVVTPGAHSYSITATDNWGIQSTNAGSFKVGMQLRPLAPITKPPGTP